MTGAELRDRIAGLIAQGSGVTELQLWLLTGADREDVAFAAGELLVAGHVTLDRDGRYYSAEGSGSSSAPIGASEAADDV